MTINTQSTPLTTLGDLSGVLEQLNSVVLGKQTQVELAMACLLAQGHLLVEDVPGTGKTTLAHALGKTLGLPWKRIQFTSDLLPADIVGVSIFNSTSNEFEFRQGPVFTSVLLADEINRATPKAQSSLLEAMEERQISVDGNTYPLPTDFFVIATQNPADQLGAYPLPESQLDRFLVGINLGYPEPSVERALLESGDQRTLANSLTPCANPRQLHQWVTEASQVHTSSTLLDYVLALVLATRENNATGLSTRAALNLVKLGKAMAYLHARKHVLPEDIQRVFPALAGHRLTGKVGTGKVVAESIMQRVPMP